MVISSPKQHKKGSLLLETTLASSVTNPVFYQHRTDAFLSAEEYCFWQDILVTCCHFY